jgi:hypothetical protein
VDEAQWTHVQKGELWEFQREFQRKRREREVLQDREEELWREMLGRMGVSLGKVGGEA